MKRVQMIAGVVGVVLVGALLVAVAVRGRDPGALIGYVEGERLYLAAPTAGALTALHVREGERVAAGAALFQIDPAPLQAQLRAAEAGVAAARAHADDVRKGQRRQELAVLDAELAAARARLSEAEAEHDRIAPLVARGVYAAARLDQARAARDAARAAVQAAERRRSVGALGGREDAVAVAERQSAQAQGGLDETRARLDALSPTAPVAGRIEEVFFRQGEWAQASQPVLALLPDNEVKVRFFAPETEVARYRPGVVVRFTCDGCGGPREARITWVSPRPEFSPPVLYSRGSRERLVFRIEAAPEDPRSLNPGQPVEVERLAPDAGQ